MARGFVMPSVDALIAMYRERYGVDVGPESCLLDDLRSVLKREHRRSRSKVIPIASVGSVRGQVITDDDIDPTGRMNGWERQRAGELEVMRQAKLIRWWKFDGIALRLADRTFYHPDFTYQTADKDLVVEEVKGFMRDDAAVKLKVAAAQYPHIRFLLVRRQRGEHGWNVTEVRAA